MKYILNETPIRTTESFGMNNIKIELTVPDSLNFHDYEIFEDSLLNIEVLNRNCFFSDIGLTHDEYKELTVDIPNDIDISYKNTVIKYIFSSKDNLVDRIIINVGKNSKANILLIYENNTNSSIFHNGEIVVNMGEGSNLNINYLNMVGKSSINIQSIKTNNLNNSKLNVNSFDLSGKLRIYRSNSDVYDNARNELNNIYIGQSSDKIDMNFISNNLKPNAESIINSEGLLKDSSCKSFKGTVDFKKGAKKSVGDVKENCTIISDTVISKSLPILLCGEEDVIGSHSASSGKIDEEKIYYLTTRGFTLGEAKKMILISKFYNVISNLNEEYQNKVINFIESIEM